MKRYKSNPTMPVWDKKPLTALKILVWYILKILTHNLWVKVLSVFFAVLLWGFIVTSTNSEQSKNFSKLDIVVKGESALNSAGYATVNNTSELRPSGVNVTISVGFNEYKSVTPASIDVSLDLSSIHSKGKHSVKVVANCSLPDVTIKSVYPPYIDIEIDEYVDKRINISPEYIGVLPDNIWRGEASVDPQSVIISGPKSIISQISGANVVVDQSTLKSSLKGDTYPLTYYDAQQNIVSGDVVRSSSLVGVTMDVQAKKTLKLDLDGSLQNADKLAEGYEILEKTYTYTTPSGNNLITLIGSKDAISLLNDNIRALPIDLNGAKEPIHVQHKLILPNGVTAINGDIVDITINISERIITSEKKATVKKTNPSWPYTVASMDTTQIIVMVTGPYSKVNNIGASTLSASVDFSALSEGTYSVPIRITGLPKGVTVAPIEKSTVEVVIRKR